MLKNLKVIFGISLFIASSLAFGAPKYGPDAIPMSGGAGADYLKRGTGPDFNHLIPFYVGEDTGSACSLATLVTLMNGIQSLNLTGKVNSDTKNFTVDSLRKNILEPRYIVQVSGDQKLSLEKGIPLALSIEEFRDVVDKAIAKAEITKKPAQVELVTLKSTQKERVAGEKEKFIENLIKNEASANDFMVLNFVQGVLTGDSEGFVGHISMVGAYDQKKKLVLILDTDRDYYGPYWSPVDKVFESMVHPKADRKAPGYLVVRL